MAACALEHEQKLSWIATINEMMQKSPRIILRLPKIRQALIAHPEPLRWYSGRKIELEMLELIDINILLPCVDIETDVETEVSLQIIRKRKEDVIMEVFQRMIMEGGRVNNVFYVWGSMLM
ncbi:hypothetical protein DPMN_114281 [Dreissena polymorpha]|uniref:Uncharacterized protein n=1 Tax=Dreissena polymorpha TaxID=45954 RepID=A0A9D4QSN5_DREPO|nr:hypothetical protein DPMN_114281 [Dreissena polymorpha]